MPTILEDPPVFSIDKQLSQAAGRIRATDVLTGLLAVVVFTLAYATAMILLDRSFGMPGWVRQVGFLGWLGVVGFAAYRSMIVPFGRNMNPIYVAKQVEAAIPDAKNVVVNYVDLKNAKLPDSIHRAVAGRAAAEVTDADIHKAGESKRLVGLGIAAASLTVFLAILFLVFSPAQFNSLVSRTFRPFASTAIASKTRITVTFPADPNVSVTSGTPVVLQVNVDGRLPTADGNDRLRLLFRHNPEDPAYESIPFESGGTNLEFQLKIPDSVVQNGIWYKVAGGDGETIEYRVTVRPRPLVLGFAVTYDYPEYLRMPRETVDRPQIEAYRGTKVTITTKTNRPVQSGRLALDGKPQTEPGVVTPEEAASIRYSFTVTESGAYRLFFTTADGDTTIDPPVYPIKVIPDNAPAVTIVKPEPEEITLPLNGQLAIDAVATDDIGIAKLAIRARLAGPVPTPFMEKAYALKLKRDEDGSYPTRVEMKDSVGIAELKTESGVPVSLKEGDTIEYWIEATDNCGYEKANVGRSTVKRVKLVAPVTQPEPKKEQYQKAEQRKQEEKKQGEQQQQKFEKEERPPPPGQKDKQPQQGEPQEQNAEPKNGEKGSQPQDAKPGENGSQTQEPKSGEKGTPSQDPKAGEKGSPQDPKNGEKPNPDGGEKGTQSQDQKAGEKGSPPDSKAGEKVTPEDSKSGEKQNPAGGEKGTPSTQPKPGESSQGGETQPSPAEQQRQKDVQEKADRVAKEIQNQKSQSGQGDGQQQDQPSKEQIEEFKQAAKDAQSSDPATKKKGEDKLDQMIGKEARQQAQKEAEQLKKDLASKDDKTREAAEKKVQEMAEKMAQEQGGSGQQTGGGQEKQPTKEQIEQFQNAAKDLNSPDPAKRAAAEKAVDDAIGKDARQQAQKNAEQLKKDLASKDDKTREAAEKKVQEMADKMAKEQGGGKPEAGEKTAGQDKKPKGGNAQSGGQQPSKEQIEEMKNAAKDLASDDPAKQQAAREKLDKMMGEQNRKDAEKLANDLKSNDPKTREAAEKKVQEMADKMAKEQGGKPDAGEKSAGGKQPTKEQVEEMKNAAKDLASDDPANKKAAQDKLDKMVGEQNRKEAEKMANDLKSNDPKTREAAEQKMKDMADKMAKEQQGGGGKPDDAKAAAAKQEEIQDAMKKLGSDDPAEKKAAQESLDKSIGENKRKAAEDLQKDLKSNNPAVRKEAEKKAEQLANANEQLPQPGQGDKPMSPEDAQKLADKAKDLTSKDESKRKDAEKELDEKVGKENREKLQKAMNDMQSGDPQKRAEAQKQMEDWKKQAEAGNPQGGRRNDDQWKPGGFGGGNPGGDPLKDNPADRLKTAELQLITFKENRNNKALREKLGFTQEEYDRFVEGYEKLVESERKRIEVTTKANPKAGPKTLNVNRGGEKVGARGTVAGPQGASAGTAPPGYAEASRKFAEEAAKKKPAGGNQ